MMPADAAILTDLYQLTMMQGYWATGRADEEAAFELFFRTVPEGGGYCIAAGIEDALDIVTQARFEPGQLDYLASLDLFQPAFLAHLRELRFTGDVRSIAEGSLVFPHEPILALSGPLLATQWFETILLNIVNFQTLIATKASRIVREAQPAGVIEFGLRRAQGPDGGLSVSKASYLAGCLGTSNVLAGKRFGVPVYGTHAHSWVMSFDDEAAAFRAYGDVFPDKSILLIDTYDTLKQGLVHAIAEAKRMEANGHKLVAIRLDSGDLAYLSKACRKELDDAGLGYVQILASGDVDEYLARDLKAQGAPIDLYGVGTRLATAYNEPALNGVYKLVALRRRGAWLPKMKISSNPAKTTIPAQKQLWRWEEDGRYLGDCLALTDEPAPERMMHPDLAYKQTSFDPARLRPLLQLRVRNGGRASPSPSLASIREHVQSELARLPEEHQRLANPHVYRVGLSPALWQLRQDLIQELS